MKNSTFKENVRKQLEVNEKIHAMGFGILPDAPCKINIISQSINALF